MLLTVLSLLILPLGLTAFFLHSGRSAWGLVLAKRAPAAGVGRGPAFAGPSAGVGRGPAFAGPSASTAYRVAQVPVWEEGAAPWVVRLAGITSFLLGQMIVPGALAAFLGFVMVIETLGTLRESVPLLVIDVLSAPTGLYVAWQLLVAGAAMLRRAPDAAERARFAARWSLLHNVALSLAVALGCVMSEGAESAIVPAAFLWAYAALSLAQALLVRSAAAALDAYDARQRA